MNRIIILSLFCLNATFGLLEKVTPAKLNPLASFNHYTENKMPWIESGYKTWFWKGNKINYLDLGGDNSKQPLLLIHGFGASVYHWRYNIPVLARDYHVFAIDLLGLGLSDKPIVEYSGELWRDQVLDFIEENIATIDNVKKCVVAGNSIGGFTALSAAASPRANQLINGCILLNAAGVFKSNDAQVSEESYTKPKPKWQTELIENFKKFVIRLSFIYTKQPTRISQVLKQVYPVDSSNVDDELVSSIQYPAQDPNAAEVFYRIVSRSSNGKPQVYIDDLLQTLQTPLMLLWGVKDPWIRTQAADRIQALYPKAMRVDVDAGHCPHDEAPDAVNAGIKKFMATI
eukprot:gene10233-13765_t